MWIAIYNLNTFESILKILIKIKEYLNIKPVYSYK